MGATMVISKPSATTFTLTQPERASCQRKILCAHPWSSLFFHLSHPKHRPAWIRTDRIFGAHGIRSDTPEARAEFEQRLEVRRHAEEQDDEEWKPLRRGWCLGSEEFKAQMLELIEDKLGDHHS